MKVTIDLGKLLEFHGEHAYDHVLANPKGFRAFMMEFLAQAENEKEKNDDYIKKTLYFPEVRFKTRSAAASVLNKMKREIAATGFVTVADYYDYSGQQAEGDLYHWGWVNINISYIYSVSEDGIESFGIYLPKPMRIDRLWYLKGECK